MVEVLALQALVKEREGKNMLTWIREKMGAFMVSVIMGFIAIVFIFSGVFNPKATRGLHEGAVAAKVNGEAISISEFSQAVNRQIEMFKGFGGGKLTEAQIKAFGIVDGVLNQLVSRKVLVQTALKTGYAPGDAEVRDEIQKIKAFQKEGQFDLLTYRAVLEANHHTPSSFERLMREDLAAQKIQEQFRRLAKVSEDEVTQEFLANHRKRTLRYVVLSSEVGKKLISVDDKQVEAFMKDVANDARIKMEFEQRKNTDLKGKKIDDAATRRMLARDLVAGQKSAEIWLKNVELGKQIAAMLSTDKASEDKINHLLKETSEKVRDSGPLSVSNPFLPNVGRADEIVEKVFGKDSRAIDLKSGGKPAMVELKDRSMVVVYGLVAKEDADLAKLPEARDELIRQIANRKENELFQEFIQNLTKAAKVDRNEEVINSIGG